MAEMVGGMQALVDAALAHRTLEGILRDLVTQVRGVLAADAATIYLADEGGRLSVGASSPGRWGGGRGVRHLGGRVTRGDARPGGRDGRRAPARRGRGDGRARGRRRAAARVRGRGPHAAPARGRAGRARDRPCACVRARAPDRRDAPAQPPARPPPRSARARGGRPLPARGVGGRGGRRLVRRDPDRRRRGGARDGRRGRQGPRRRVDGRPAAERAAGRTRSRATTAAAWWSGSTGCCGRRPRRARWRRCCT